MTTDELRAAVAEVAEELTDRLSRQQKKGGHFLVLDDDDVYRIADKLRAALAALEGEDDGC